MSMTLMALYAQVLSPLPTRAQTGQASARAGVRARIAGAAHTSLVHRPRPTAPSAGRDVLPCETVCPEEDHRECIGIVTTAWSRHYK